jgi:predicted nucleotidyltransferase
MATLPDEVERYLEVLVERLRSGLGERLVAVWLIGSGGMGAFRPGESDLDVAVVVSGPPVDVRVRDIPVPATKLEIVFYDRELRVLLDPNPGSGDHWYVIDLAVAREHGRALLGPPPSELIPEIPREEILAALDAGDRWHAEHEPGSPNVERSRVYRETGRWVPKRPAG